VRLIPLGGLEEIGKNMLLLETEQDILVVDAGQLFPDEELPGIDLVIPDFSYLRKKAAKLREVIITHGHENHTGDLPFLIKEFNLPVYATRLTLGLIKAKLAEHGLAKKAKLREIKPGQTLNLNSFQVEFIRVGHSIPDGVGLAIHTPAGLIIHSGDFKLDQTPIDGLTTEFNRFAEYKGKALLLLSDSTNAETPGYTQTEARVGQSLRSIVSSAPGRVIVASFASHIHRIQQVLNTAALCGRKVVVCGRTMVNNVEIAKSLGYLKIPPETEIISLSELNQHPPEQLLILSTGSQGEPLSALARMAGKNHKYILIQPGDTVILSASPIPGNEKSVSRIINLLYKAGAEVHYKNIADVHVSGHAAQEELKLLLNLVKPKYFMPIHGEYRHLYHHAKLAQALGYKPKNIVLASNGDVIECTAKKVKIVSRVAAGMSFVDGLNVGDISDVVIRDRQVLAQDGIVIAVVTVNSQGKSLMAEPDLITRGFILTENGDSVLGEAKQQIKKAISSELAKNITDFSILRREIRASLTNFLYNKTRKRPMIIPVLVEV